MLRMLLVGSDSRLLATRAAVLLKTGAAVVYRDTSGALGIMDREAFDLIVLCHSLPETDVAVIVEKVHRKIPGAKILMVNSALNGSAMYTDSHVDATSIPEPGHLIARAMELLHITPYAGSRGSVEVTLAGPPLKN
jgi:CheY-like chemotaxis protein